MRILKLNIPTITSPKKIIKTAPICLMISWYVNKNSDIYDVVKPIIIKILENPSKNRMVCKSAFLFIFLFSSFISLTLIPVIYDKNAG